MGENARKKVDRRVLERDLRSAQIRPAAISANVGVELYMIEELRSRYPMPVAPTA